VIVVVTVSGSPTCALFGFTSAAMVKLPTAPPKSGGAPGGRGFTSSVTASLFSFICWGVLGAKNGSLKKLSMNGSFISNRSRGLLELREAVRGIRTTGFVSTGPISIFPLRTGDSAVLNV
jgi:hypothetical protein